jgi:LmbE family N-acetylglucosaminyl deacetylase
VNKSALIIAAHPDDEVLGCGGTIAKLADDGFKVHVAFLADGVLSRLGEKAAQQLELASRRSAAQTACEILGVKSVSFGDFPDNRMDTIPLIEIAQAVEMLVIKHQPVMVLTHHSGDLNVDHRFVHQATVIACRPQQGNPVKTLLCYEVPSSTEWQLSSSNSVFMPNWFVNISNTLDRKLDALEAYTNELRAWPHPRSMEGIKNLAHWRGATVGVDAAEAFVLGRQLT